MKIILMAKWVWASCLLLTAVLVFLVLLTLISMTLRKTLISEPLLIASENTAYRLLCVGLNEEERIFICSVKSISRPSKSNVY